MDLTKTCVAQVPKCSSASQNVDKSVVEKIDSYFSAKKTIVLNASEMKRQIHSEINELIEILKEREHELCLQIDQETLVLCQDVELYAASLLGYSSESMSKPKLPNESDCSFLDYKISEDDKQNQTKLIFGSNFNALKAILPTYGEIKVINLKQENSTNVVQEKCEPLREYFRQLRASRQISPTESSSEISDESVKEETAAESSPDSFEIIAEPEDNNSEDLSDDIEVISKFEQTDTPSMSYCSPEISPPHHLLKKMKEKLKAMKRAQNQKKAQETTDDKDTRNVESGLSSVPNNAAKGNLLHQALKVLATVDEPVPTTSNTPETGGTTQSDSYDLFHNIKLKQPATRALTKVPFIDYRPSAFEAEKSKLPSDALKLSFIEYFSNDNPEEWLPIESPRSYLKSTSCTNNLKWMPSYDKNTDKWLSQIEKRNEGLPSKNVHTVFHNNQYNSKAKDNLDEWLSFRNTANEWLCTKVSS